MRLPSHVMTIFAVLWLGVATAPGAVAQVTVIRAGGLIDPEAGTLSTNQLILVEAGRFTAIGANVPNPHGAEIIDLHVSFTVDR